MKKTIRVLYKPAGKPFEVREIPNTLKACQELVGGYIEVVKICRDVLLVCNEEGLILGLEPNPFLGEPFVGDIFCCGEDGEEFADVPESFVEMVRDIYVRRDRTGIYAGLRRTVMVDREKVFAGLKCHANTFDCKDCPYQSISRAEKLCSEVLAGDALELLKEQNKAIASYQMTINLLNAEIQRIGEGNG